MTMTPRQPEDEMEMEPTLPENDHETDSELDELFQHLDYHTDDISSRLIRNRVLNQAYESKHEIMVGQYVLDRRLGKGGMGEVYAARDSLSNLEVAVKLLHPTGSPVRDRELILREARSLARVKNPNVVRLLYVGQHDDRLFIVMERIKGQSLRTWQTDPNRTISELLDAYIQAARGLAAAHRAGVVHHDFKPTNALVADDGRVIVMDFGLAGLTPASRSGDELELIESATIRGVGTLRYMSPERVACRKTNASSDQFSFFLALHEAIHEVPALPASSVTARVDALLTCELQAPPPTPGVSSRLRAAIARGLARDPRDRFASMDAVVDELSSINEPRRKWPWLVGAAACVAAAGLGVGIWMREPPAAPASTPDPLAEVWSSEQRDAVAALPSMPGPVLVAQLDEYASDWRQSYDQAQHQPRVRSCLMGQRERFDTLVDQLVDDGVEPTWDRSPAMLALEATAELPQPHTCFDIASTPPEGTDEAEIEELEALLGQGDLARLEGRFEQSLGFARAAHERAVAANWIGAEIDALELLGHAEAGLGRSGVEHFRAARKLALRVDDIPRAAQLSVRMARATNRSTASSERLAALILAEDLVDDDLETQMELALAWAREHGFEREYEEAETLLDATLETYERASLARPHLLAELLRRRADAISAQGRLDEADEAYQLALERMGEVLGQDSADALSQATLWSNAGIEAMNRGELERARARIERGKSIRESVLPQDHPLIGRSVVHLAWLDLYDRDYTAALAKAQRAVTALDVEGVHSDFLCDAYLVEGAALEGLASQGQGSWEDALAALERAAATRPPSKWLPAIDVERANVLTQLGRDAEALALLEAKLPEIESEALIRGRVDDLVTIWSLWLELLSRQQPQLVEENLKRIVLFDHLSDEHRRRLEAAASLP